jgi:protein gp37
MGLSRIEWTDYTFNPWIGCTKVDELCAHCYAESSDKLRKWTPEGWGKGKPRKRTSPANWRLPLRWDAEAAAHPHAKCNVCGKIVESPVACPWCVCGGDFIDHRPRVFCASLADWLDDDGVPIEWLADLLEVIFATPRLDWLLLTKRPENWRARLLAVAAHREATGHGAAETFARVQLWLRGTPPAHVWIGTSAGTQRGAKVRIPHALAIPAPVHFLSMEPLLEAVDLDHLALTPALEISAFRRTAFHGARALVDWVIVGGESGAKARPMHPAWARALRDQCARFGVPFFFKQWGEWSPSLDESARQMWLTPGGRTITQVAELPEGGSAALLSRVGKHRAGRLLDGVEHSAFPAIAGSQPPRNPEPLV